MKEEATVKKEFTIKQASIELGMSHDMVTRLWHKGIIKGRKKNPFARNSPILISFDELSRVKKIVETLILDSNHPD